MKELDLLQCARILLKRAWIVALAACLCAAIAFMCTTFFVTPTYKAHAKMYVNNTSIAVGSVGININNLTAAQQLVNTYIELLNTRNTLDKVIEQAGVSLSSGKLKGMISASPVNETEIFQITVTDTDPERAVHIANTIAQVLPEEITRTVEGSSVIVVDWADGTAYRSSSNSTRNTLIGFLAGAAISAIIILLFAFYDPYVGDEDYMTKAYDIPLLAVIPTIGMNSKNEYYYRKKNRSYYYKTAYAQEMEDSTNTSKPEEDAE